MIHIIDKYQDDTTAYIEEIRKQKHQDPLFENVDFQKAVNEISVFIYEQFREKGKEITNVLDLYIYIHEKGIDHIMASDELSVATKKVANRLYRYLLNRRSNMVSIIMNFYTRFHPTEGYKNNRYEYAIDALAEGNDEKIIAMALMYTYLTNEVTKADEWGQMTQKMSHEEIYDFFTSFEMSEFLNDAQIEFFKDNAELFKEHLGKKV